MSYASSEERCVTYDQSSHSTPPAFVHQLTADEMYVTSFTSTLQSLYPTDDLETRQLKRNRPRFCLRNNSFVFSVTLKHSTYPHLAEGVMYLSGFCLSVSLSIIWF